MAHQCLRRPVLSALGPNGARAFHVVVPRAAAQGQPQLNIPRQPAERSQSSQMSSANVTIAQIPTDIGLFPGTFITPRLANYPFTSVTKLPKFIFNHVKQRLVDRVSSLVFKYTAKPKPTLNRKEIAPTAATLYTAMYTAFADGNRSRLNRICCSGLRDNFGSRIASRGQETMKWELVRMSRPRLISDRVSQLPIDNAFIRQAVVRIKSTQKLTRFRRDGSIVPGSGEPRTVIENVVVQKRILRGEQDDWMVWGMADETAIDKLEEEDRQKYLD